MMRVQGRTRRGLSLMEVLIGVAIIAILVGILIPTVSRARQSARVVVCTNNLQQINTSFRAWGQNRSMRLPDSSEWITAVKASAKESRILYCPDGDGPSEEAQVFDEKMITTKKAYGGVGHPAPDWTPKPKDNPDANSFVVDIKYQNVHVGNAKFIITRIAGNSWKAVAVQIDPGGGWGGPPINMQAGNQSWTNIQQGQVINFLFGDSGTNYGFNTVMANVLAPKPNRVLAMDYGKMYIDYSGDADDDATATYLKTGRHYKGAKVNALYTDGSVQLLTMKELNPTATLIFKNK